MKMLTYSRDSVTLELLNRDYKELNVEIPTVEKSDKEAQQ